MTTKKMSDLSDEQREWAKNEYIHNHTSVTEIATALNVGRTSVSYYANQYWKQELNLMRAELFARFTENKRMHFTKMSEDSIKIIEKCLKNTLNQERPPTLREAKDAVAVLEALDKITRLDEGNPTEITSERIVSIRDVEAIIKLNPFKEVKEIEDASFKEIDQDSSANNVISNSTDNIESDSGEQVEHSSQES